MATWLDYQDIVPQVAQPFVVENVVIPTLDKLLQFGTKNTTITNGASISDRNSIAVTSSGGAFTRADAWKASLTQDWVTPTWTKKYYQENFKIRKEDLKELVTPEAVQNFVMDGMDKSAKKLMNNVLSGVLTQVKADIDSSATYSDAALTRVTALASEEEATNTAFTLALARAIQNAIFLKDPDGTDWSQYTWLLQGNVYNIANPLMEATVTKTIINPTVGQANASGYGVSQYFDQIRVATIGGMTTGDCFLIHKDDFQIQEHCSLEVEQDPSPGEWAALYHMVIGVNGWVRRPARNGKMTSKD